VHSALRMAAALAGVNADVLVIAPVDGFGIVVPSDGGRAMLQSRGSTLLHGTDRSPELKPGSRLLT
jgi:hypothetical protein